MKPVLPDTDTLSLFLRGVPEVTAHTAAYLGQQDAFNFSIISYYEIKGHQLDLPIA